MSESPYLLTHLLSTALQTWNMSRLSQSAPLLWNLEQGPQTCQSLPGTPVRIRVKECVFFYQKILGADTERLKERMQVQNTCRVQGRRLVCANDLLNLPQQAVGPWMEQRQAATQWDQEHKDFHYHFLVPGPPGCLCSSKLKVRFVTWES